MPSLSLPSVLVTVLWFLAGCSSGGGGGGGAASQLAGSVWQGTWSTSALERLGGMHLVFQSASGNAVSGSASFELCGAGGLASFNGTRTGTHASLAIVHTFQDPDLRIECEIDIAGASITGTYTVTSNNCAASL